MKWCTIKHPIQNSHALLDIFLIKHLRLKHCKIIFQLSCLLTQREGGIICFVRLFCFIFYESMLSLNTKEKYERLRKYASQSKDPRAFQVLGFQVFTTTSCSCWFCSVLRLGIHPNPLTTLGIDMHHISELYTALSQSGFYTRCTY